MKLTPHIDSNPPLLLKKTAKHTTMRYPLLLASLLFLQFTAILPAADLKTERVIFVMTDGFRWQDLFRGAEAKLLNKEPGGIKELDPIREAFDRPTPEERRAALLPFVWNTIAVQGQIYGNLDKDSPVTVTNGKNFSYPGYSEVLCGFPDPRIDSNKKVPNPNFTVFEWLYKKPKLEGRVAAFAAWDVFPSIFNVERCGFLVNAGYDPLTDLPDNPRIQLLNQLKQESYRHWGGEPFDPITFHTALEYLRIRKPRLMFLSLGETDEWGHAGRYDEYLRSAHRVDHYLKTLWDTLQADPEYAGKTTLIISTDHGRGEPPVGWKSHGADIPGSEYIWIMALGPDTPALGERTKTPRLGQNQIAATIAALLGEDYPAAVPQAGAPVTEIYTPPSPRKSEGSSPKEATSP